MNERANGGNLTGGMLPVTLNRRLLLQNAAALGLSSTMLGAFLNAYGSPARAQSYDPKKYAGTQISILMTGDENDHRALADLLPELEEQTGIQLEITSPALGPLIEKTLQNLKAERSSFELINYLGFLTTQQVGGGYYREAEPLYRQPRGNPAGLGFRRFPAAGDEERRHL